MLVVVQAGGEGTHMAEKDQEGERLDRADLWRLHEYCASEIRNSLDFAHRNLIFYVGLLSALLAAVVAGLLNVHQGDRRAFGLLIGAALILVLAEVGYSTVEAFYHRFIDAYFTLINIQQMLRLNDWNWIAAESGKPYARSKYGGVMAQWVDPIDWLKRHQELTVEEAKEIAMKSQPVKHRDILKNLFAKPSEFPARTLMDARRTMWAFEFASLLLAPAVLVMGLS
jgi:hypothetical protein